MKKQTVIFGLMALAVLLVGCQEPPQQAVDTARQTLADAESAEADEYASDELAAARDAMRAVDEELKAQADKLALFRSYEHAGELTAQAEQAAAAARDAAVENKQQAKQAAEAARAAVESSLAQAQELLDALGECPRKPKGFQADLEALQGRLEGLRLELGGIDEALQAEEFADATARAEALDEQVQLLVADLSSAKEKLGC